MADVCHVTHASVINWRKRDRIPAEYCRMLEFACDGQYTRYQMRPDVFGSSECCTLVPAISDIPKRSGRPKASTARA
ncbi:MAG: helix-turn-helix domain-containing protein [Magnetococcales bacterium]|nr:helix-turn-helix domain-containing protein [Magnetococcales bacterium]